MYYVSFLFIFTISITFYTFFMSFISNNTYRVLGVCSNASLKDIQKNISKLKAFAKIAIVLTATEPTSTLRVHFTHALNVMVATTYIQAVMSVRYAQPDSGLIPMDLHMLARTVLLESTGQRQEGRVKQVLVFSVPMGNINLQLAKHRARRVHRENT